MTEQPIDNSVRGPAALAALAARIAQDVEAINRHPVNTSAYGVGSLCTAILLLAQAIKELAEQPDA